MLVTLSGAVGSPGVYETEAGTPIEHVLDLAGGAREPLRALLVGGYFGAWREPEPGLRLEGAVGAGVVVALGDSACPVAETARLTAWLARESAGQCGPCVHGLGALAALLERVAAGRPEPGDLPRLARWTAAVQGRGACAHPDGAARMLASAGHEFADELDDHARHGPCDRCAAPSSLRLP
jgi:NADH:ubiquinone oxidoreductase subunit F (NADH-binding)